MSDTLMELEKIVTYVISIIIVIITIIINVLKALKNKKVLFNSLKLEELIKELMSIVETYHGFSGENKKEWVKVKVNQFCIDNNIKFDENEVSSKIESLIDITKSVNKREKDEERL